MYYNRMCFCSKHGCVCVFHCGVRASSSGGYFWFDRALRLAFPSSDAQPLTPVQPLAVSCCQRSVAESRVPSERFEQRKGSDESPSVYAVAIAAFDEAPTLRIVRLVRSLFVLAVFTANIRRSDNKKATVIQIVVFRWSHEHWYTELISETTEVQSDSLFGRRDRVGKKIVIVMKRTSVTIEHEKWAFWWCGRTMVAF